MNHTSTLDSIADARFRRVCKAIVEHMERLHVPGVAIGIAHGDEEHTAGFGVTSVEHPLPVDADTLFQIGSITKTVTGTAAMRLVEQRKLDLDAPVRGYLLELRLADEQVAASVTMRHLFNHTAGWAGDYFDDLGNGDDALGQGGGTNGQLSAFIMVPERRFAITVLTNAERGGELNEEVTRLALQEFLGVSEKQPEPLDVPEEQLAPYAARYESLLSICDLELRDGALVVQVTPKGGFPTKDSPASPPPPPVRLALCGVDQVMVLDEPFKGARGEFLRNPDGSIAWLRIGGRVQARQG